MGKRNASFRSKNPRWQKLIILPQEISLRSKLFLSFYKEILSCFQRATTGKVGSILTSIFMRLPALELLEAVCRDETQWCRISVLRVRLSEHNQFQRLFRTDLLCKPLAVSSCLDGAGFRRSVPLVQVLFAVGELPPELTPKRPTTGRFCLDSVGLCKDRHRRYVVRES